MILKTTTLLFLTCFLTASFIEEEKDELYLNYLAAIRNTSTFQYFLVVKVKNSKHGTIREYCTKGNFLKGALHREYKLGYNNACISKVYSIAVNNKDRCFEFKKKKALNNISSWNYSIDDLKQLFIKLDHTINRL